MDPTLAQIVMFGGNFAPLSWAFCNGALMSIAENTALFSLLGTTFGGDGQTTFALPDLRGRVPIGTGQGGGLSYYDLGQVSGTENVTLIQTNLPAHNHLLMAFSEAANDPAPQGNLTANTGTDLEYTDAAPTALMAPTSVGLTGKNIPFNNMQPYLAINFIIAVEGIYPSRN